MDFDLIFVIGMVLSAFAIPSLAAAYADRRLPKLAALMLIVAVIAIAAAIQESPETYALDTIDDTVLAVLGRYLN